MVLSQQMAMKESQKGRGRLEMRGEEQLDIRQKEENQEDQGDQQVPANKLHATLRLGTSFHL